MGIGISAGETQVYNRNLQDGTGQLNVTIPCTSYSSVVQGTWEWLDNNVSPPFSSYFRNNPGTINDEITYKSWLPKGTHVFIIDATKNTDCGIIHVYLDGVDTTERIDLYNAGGTVQAAVTCSLVVGVAGQHTISLKMASKNAGSSAYRCNMRCIRFRDV